MALDHSLSYKKFKLKNIPHKLRLKKILSLLEQMSLATGSYADVGCSNGYITNIIAGKFNFQSASGLDYVEENLQNARQNYPHISFYQADLNNPLPAHLYSPYDLITCFETLEHVGDLKSAITNLIDLSNAQKYSIIISVPIEVGFWGIVKFLLKYFLYKGYSLSELGQVKPSHYFKSLLKGENITQYRDTARKGWGTHFGFDYRTVDHLLTQLGVHFKAKNYFTTRFYYITRQA